MLRPRRPALVLLPSIVAAAAIGYACSSDPDPVVIPAGDGGAEGSAADAPSPGDANGGPDGSGKDGGASDARPDVFFAKIIKPANDASFTTSDLVDYEGTDFSPLADGGVIDDFEHVFWFRKDQGGVINPEGEGLKVTRVNPLPAGTYELRLVVYDKNDAAAEDTVTFTVK